jgi:hypothetical protein
MSYIKTINEAKQLLADRQPFNAGTLTANYEDIGESLRYIVRSYGVEIADYTEGTTHPTAYQHSKTTSKHANIVKRAWGLVK